MSKLLHYNSLVVWRILIGESFFIFLALDSSFHKSRVWLHSTALLLFPTQVYNSTHSNVSRLEA